MALGERKEERGAAYQALFRSELEPTAVKKIRSAVNGGFALGNERFKAEIATILGRRVERGISGRPKKKDEQSGEARSAL